MDPDVSLPKSEVSNRIALFYGNAVTNSPAVVTRDASPRMHQAPAPYFASQRMAQRPRLDCSSGQNATTRGSIRSYFSDSPVGPSFDEHRASFNFLTNQRSDCPLIGFNNSGQFLDRNACDFEIKNGISSLSIFSGASARNSESLYSSHNRKDFIHYPIATTIRTPFQQQSDLNRCRQWRHAQQPWRTSPNQAQGVYLPSDLYAYQQQLHQNQEYHRYQFHHQQERQQHQRQQQHENQQRRQKQHHHYQQQPRSFVSYPMQYTHSGPSSQQEGLAKEGTGTILSSETTCDQSQATTSLRRKSNYDVLQQLEKQLVELCAKGQMPKALSSKPKSNILQHVQQSGEKLLDKTLVKRDFQTWLVQRKRSWRKAWNVKKPKTGDFKRQKCEEGYTVISNKVKHEQKDTTDEQEVRNDFWITSGFSSFDAWLSSSKIKWKRQYTWNREKTSRLEQETVEVVHFPSSAQLHLLQSRELKTRMITFQRWLRIRKQQWRIQNRKRQRLLTCGPSEKRAEACHVVTERSSKFELRTFEETTDNGDHTVPQAKEPYHNPNSLSNDVFCIDVVLEHLEERKKAASNRATFDLSLLFQPERGMSDDLVGYILEFLPTSEHGILLCLNKEANAGMKERSEMWKSLCPSNWDLPRRPRQPWHSIYLHRLKLEYQKGSKLADDVLEKAVEIMMRSDACHKIERLVTRAETKFNFKVDYTSGIVLERNSLLNIATIYQRCKTVKWLVDVKGADIESMDRGRFTPLLNAAWTGNKYLVRTLLSRGADRNKIGLFHYTQGIAPVDFKGLNAEGWARKKGYLEVAKTIKQGI